MKNKLILGTANFGMDYGIANGRRLDEVAVGALLSLARDHGLWGIDTAGAYGDAEKRLGLFFGQEGKALKVITKLPERDYTSEEAVEQEVAAALARLQLDSIDCLLIHSYRSYRTHGDTILPVLRRLCAEKVIGQWGVSVYYPEEMKAIAAESKEALAFEFPVNLFDRRFIGGTRLEGLKDAGFTLFARSVFLQGLFFLDGTHWHPHFSRVKEKVAQLQALSVEAGLEKVSLPLLFVLTNPVIDGVVMGVDSPAQLLGNLAAISASQCIAFDKISERLDAFCVDDEAITVPANWPREPQGSSA